MNCHVHYIWISEGIEKREQSLGRGIHKGVLAGNRYCHCAIIFKCSSRQKHGNLHNWGAFTAAVTVTTEWLFHDFLKYKMLTHHKWTQKIFMRYALSQSSKQSIDQSVSLNNSYLMIESWLIMSLLYYAKPFFFLIWIFFDI